MAEIGTVNENESQIQAQIVANIHSQIDAPLITAIAPIPPTSEAKKPKEEGDFWHSFIGSMLLAVVIVILIGLLILIYNQPLVF